MAQNIADPADVKARLNGSLLLLSHTALAHWDSNVLHIRVWCDVDRLKGAETYQGQLPVTVFLGPLSSGTHSAVKEQRGSGVPHQALAANVHITPWIKGYRWVARVEIMRKWSNHDITHTILPKHVI